MERQISVAILTGGRSRRMGRDKALLPWDGGDVLDRMLAVAGGVAHAAETLVVGDRPEYHRPGGRVVADLYPGAGPLGGIATALDAAKTARVLVLAVDLPLVSGELLDAMVAHLTTADILVPEIPTFESGDGDAVRLQGLHAIYSRACLEPARRRLCQNERRVTGIYGDVTVERLNERWVRQFDPELRSFINVNDSAEYERAKSYES